MVFNNKAGCEIGRLEERQVGTISDGNLQGRGTPRLPSIDRRIKARLEAPKLLS